MLESESIEKQKSATLAGLLDPPPPPNESTLLVTRHSTDTAARNRHPPRALRQLQSQRLQLLRRRRDTSRLWNSAQYVIALLLATLIVVVEYQPTLSEHGELLWNNHRSRFHNYHWDKGRRITARVHHVFPKDFVWGSATSAYQIEGGSEERGISIWDTFCKTKSQHTSLSSPHILDGSSGDIACDHYHMMEEDVQLMKELGLQAYRFSIAWTRILPNGKVSQKGIEFYDRLINALLEANIVPYATLFHWDLPQRLQDRYGGWMDRRIIDDFGDYAKICFRHFGDRVKHWITINESWTIAVNGYNNHVHAPGHYLHPATETYLVAHHLLLAHARAVHIYRRDFAHQQHGMIGISNCADYRYPADSNSDADWDAAQRAMVFQLAWLADPIWLGDYPQEMKDRLGSRLPKFTREEQFLLKGSSDFFGLNHYSSLLASDPSSQHYNDDNEPRAPSYEGYWADINVAFSTEPNWRSNAMGWSVVPEGFRELLLWIADRYDNPTILITENGSAENEPNLDAALHDEARRVYFESYLRACAEAMEDGVDVMGYFAWSLMDNFEWQYGYQRRFGICYVDFDTMKRTPKKSALWYRDTILANGHNIRRRVNA